MKKTIHVTICTGTTCHLMGATHLHNVDQQLAAEIRQRVSISASHCLRCCGDENVGRAPFVKINDTIIAEATPERVVQAIRTAAAAGGRS